MNDATERHFSKLGEVEASARGARREAEAAAAAAARADDAAAGGNAAAGADAPAAMRGARGNRSARGAAAPAARGRPHRLQRLRRRLPECARGGAGVHGTRPIAGRAAPPPSPPQRRWGPHTGAVCSRPASGDVGLAPRAA